MSKTKNEGKCYYSGSRTDDCFYCWKSGVIDFLSGDCHWRLCEDHIHYHADDLPDSFKLVGAKRKTTCPFCLKLSDHDLGDKHFHCKSCNMDYQITQVEPAPFVPEDDGLDDATPQCPDDEHDAFIKHLKRATEIVATWPKWKQEVLGGTYMPQCPDYGEPLTEYMKVQCRPGHIKTVSETECQQRVIRCMNACAGIPSDKLEEWVREHA